MTTVKSLPLGPQKTQYVPRDIHSLSSEQLVLCSDHRARAIVSYEDACSMCLLPLGCFDSGTSSLLTVAVCEHRWSQARQFLRFSFSGRIEPIFLEQTTIEQAIFCSYKGQHQELDAAIAPLLKAAQETEHKGEEHEADRHSFSGTDGTFLRALFEHCLARRCSDLHIVPMQSECILRIRRDGTLMCRSISDRGRSLSRKLVRRLRVLTSVEHLPEGSPSEGAFSFSTASGQRTLRVSIVPTLYGDKAVIRLQCLSSAKPFCDLGFSSTGSSTILRVLKRTEGLILVCGPTGSGKTTTLYSCCALLAEQGKNVVCLEDPIEGAIAGVSQTQVGDTLSYSDGFRLLLRQDPDVIMLGEIRERSTAAAVVQASRTGHLVLASMHAANPTQAIQRLGDLGISRRELQSAVTLVLAQRLLPRLCPECRVIDLIASRKFGLPCYRSVGCSACEHTGVSGRVLLEDLALPQGLESEFFHPEDMRQRMHELLRHGTVCVDDFMQDTEYSCP